MLDNKLNDRLRKYMDSFPDGSLGKILASFCPVPGSGKLEDKFEFFYRPYNYWCNTQKFISYQGEGRKGERDPYTLYNELLNSEHFIDTYLRSLSLKTRPKEP